MIALEEALALYDSQLAPLPAAEVDLAAARGQVLAEDVASGVDLPMFSQSAVDGYALRAADTAAAPVRLALAGEVAAGDARAHRLAPGQALRIFTGGRLPEGSDSIARQEIVRREGDSITLEQPLAVGVDIRVQGEELRRGARIAPAGTRLGAGLVAALAMAGVTRLRVRRAPRIAILVSGDEVAPAGAPLAPGQIHDANGPLIGGWLAERGLPSPAPVYVPDDPARLEQALGAALEAAELVLTSGGVSVGDRDYVPGVAERLGVRKVFWQVAQKPGKPLWFGTRGDRALLAMPGNPAAVLVGLEVHAARILSRLQGEAAPAPRWHLGLLAEPHRGDPRRDGLVRMRRRYGEDGRVWLERLPRQDSHMLSNLVEADALAWVPRSEAALAAGTPVRWLALGRD